MDGSDDYVTIPTDAALDVTDVSASPFTIWMRIKWSGTATKGLFMIGSGDYDSLVFYINGTSLLALLASVNGSSWGISQASGATVVPSGSWTSVALTRDTSGTYRLYIAGVLRGAVTNATDIMLNDFTARIGDHYSGAAGWNFDGRMADVRFYSAELDATEILALHDSTGTPSSGTGEGDLAFEWRHDDGSGTNINDYTGGNDGTAVGSPAWAVEDLPLT